MDRIPRLLRCAHLLCVQDVVSGLLYAIGSCFAVTCASNRKVITAFRNVALKEPQSYKVNTTGAYFLVSRLHPEQIVDDRAIPVVFKRGSHAQDWAVLEVESTYNPTFSFIDTIALRPRDQPLLPVTVESTRLMTIFYELDNPYVPFIEATASSWCRVDHVFSETVQMTEGQYRGSSGCVLVDANERAVAIHVDSVNPAVLEKNLQIRVSDRVNDSGAGADIHDEVSRNGSIVFNVQEIIDELNVP